MDVLRVTHPAAAGGSEMVSGLGAVNVTAVGALAHVSSCTREHCSLQMLQSEGCACWPEGDAWSRCAVKLGWLRKLDTSLPNSLRQPHLLPRCPLGMCGRVPVCVAHTRVYTGISFHFAFPCLWRMVIILWYIYWSSRFSLPCLLPTLYGLSFFLPDVWRFSCVPSTNPRSVTCSAMIFSTFATCFFTEFTLLGAEQCCLVLIELKSSVFCFLVCAFCVLLKKYFPTLRA